jgi:hypothetical protein
MTVDELLEALEPFRGCGKVLMGIDSEGINYPIKDVTVEEDYDGKPYVCLNEADWRIGDPC